MTILVTGANFVLDWLAGSDEPVVNLDKLTYAGNLHNLHSLDSLQGDACYRFVDGDICDGALVERLLEEHRPRAVINFAAEFRVDRSIHGPEDFIHIDVVGSFRLLEAAMQYWKALSATQKKAFRLLHLSTDEVYGTLTRNAPALTEEHNYEPTNSPNSASKAASDHVVRGWHHSCGLPVPTTNCSNNYGSLHFSEKRIPLMIVNALAGRPLPIYGDSMQERAWLYVKDHCNAIRRVLEAGRVSETYNVGGWNEKPNIGIVKTVRARLDELRPRADGDSYAQQIYLRQESPRPRPPLHHQRNASWSANWAGSRRKPLTAASARPCNGTSRQRCPAAAGTVRRVPRMGLEAVRNIGKDNPK